MLERARDEEVMIYAIGLESEYFNGARVVRRSRTAGCGKFAEETGGGYFELEKTSDLAPTFTRVAQELHSQYVLGFDATQLDGKVHKLTVRVKQPGMTARARKSYLASVGESLRIARLAFRRTSSHTTTTASSTPTTHSAVDENDHSCTTITCLSFLSQVRRAVGGKGLTAAMMLTEQEFRVQSDQALEQARRALLPLADQNGFEVELQDGVLNLVFEEPGEAKFVVSPNAPVRQIWVSAMAGATSSLVGRAEAFAIEGETLSQLLERLARAFLGS